MGSGGGCCGGGPAGVVVAVAKSSSLVRPSAAWRPPRRRILRPGGCSSPGRPGRRRGCFVGRPLSAWPVRRCSPAPGGKGWRWRLPDSPPLGDLPRRRSGVSEMRSGLRRRRPQRLPRRPVLRGRCPRRVSRPWRPHASRGRGGSRRAPGGASVLRKQGMLQQALALGWPWSSRRFGSRGASAPVPWGPPGVSARSVVRPALSGRATMIGQGPCGSAGSPSFWCRQTGSDRAGSACGSSRAPVDLEDPRLELLLRDCLRGRVGSERSGRDSGRWAGRGILPPNKLGLRLFRRQVKHAKSKHTAVSGPQLDGMARRARRARTRPTSALALKDASAAHNPCGRSPARLY